MSLLIFCTNLMFSKKMCTKLLPASEPHHCTNICLNIFIFYFDEIFSTFLSRWSKNIHNIFFIINLYWYAADHMALEFNIVEPIDARLNYHGCYESDECCKEFFSMRQIEFHVFFFFEKYAMHFIQWNMCGFILSRICIIS